MSGLLSYFWFLNHFLVLFSKRRGSQELQEQTQKVFLPKLITHFIEQSSMQNSNLPGTITWLKHQTSFSSAQFLVFQQPPTRGPALTTGATSQPHLRRVSSDFFQSLYSVLLLQAFSLFVLLPFSTISPKTFSCPPFCPQFVFCLRWKYTPTILVSSPGTFQLKQEKEGWICKMCSKGTEFWGDSCP